MSCELWAVSGVMSTEIQHGSSSQPSPQPIAHSSKLTASFSLVPIASAPYALSLWRDGYRVPSVERDPFTLRRQHGPQEKRRREEEVGGEEKVRREEVGGEEEVRHQEEREEGRREEDDHQACRRYGQEDQAGREDQDQARAESGVH